MVIRRIKVTRAFGRYLLILTVSEARVQVFDGVNSTLALGPRATSSVRRELMSAKKNQPAVPVKQPTATKAAAKQTGAVTPKAPANPRP